MERKVNISLPKGKEAKNVQFKVEDGKIEVIYDLYDIFNPKDGDFVTDFDGDVFIVKNTDEDGMCCCYVGYNKIAGFQFNMNNWTRPKRYSTLQEKKAFLERLEKECGKTWNAKNKCLEDIYVPKFGDIVRVENPSIAFKRNYTICIYPNKNEQYNQCYIEDFFDIANIDMSGRLCFSCGNTPVGRLNIVRASESEKQELFDKLAEVGKRWNPDTKQLEDIRWKPKEWESYFFVNSYGGISKTIRNTACDSFIIGIGNAFKTEEAAKPYADQMKEIFKNLKAE